MSGNAFKDQIIKKVAEKQKVEGLVQESEIPDLVPDIPIAEVLKIIHSMLRSGEFMDHPMGGLMLSQLPDDPSTEAMWMDIEKLPWKEVVPKSAQARKKGNYFNTPENKKNPVYKMLMEKLVHAIDVEKRYNTIVESNGKKFTIWFDRSGGISRREVKDEKDKHNQVQETL